jgi:hypothetical protein
MLQILFMEKRIRSKENLSSVEELKEELNAAALPSA